MLEYFYNRRIFTDFDELAENLRDWELEIFQLEKGKFVNSIEQLSSGELMISAAQFSGHTHQVGNSPPGRTFAIVADAETHITWRKHSIGKDSLMIVCHEGTLRCVMLHTLCSYAAQEMRVGPSEPACRSRFQTTSSCCGKEPWW